MQRVVLQPRQPKRKVIVKKKRRFFKGFVVVFGAMLLTTLAIEASDKMQTPTELAKSNKESVDQKKCPDDMVYIPESGGGFCIDKYEVSPSDACAYQSPGNQNETRQNIDDPQCDPVSISGKQPWVNVAWNQAFALCLKAGKRLPTNNEWFRASMGTPDRVDEKDSALCALGLTGKATADPTGVRKSCTSFHGAHDMVGNVWEWVDGEVIEGVFNGITLPSEGYVHTADTSGMPTETATSSNETYNSDYFFADPVGVKGVFRGGFWSLKEKAGVYSVNTASPLSFVGVAVGFRCAQNAR